MPRLTPRPSPDARTILFVAVLVLLAVLVAGLFLRGRGGQSEAENDEATISGTVPVMSDGGSGEESDRKERTTKGTVPMFEPVDDLRETMEETGQPRLSDLRDEWSHSEQALHLALGELVAAREVKVFPVGDVVKVKPVE